MRISDWSSDVCSSDLVSSTTRSCSTLLCFKLLSSACGTPSALEVMNTAVPGTRVAALAADWMNTLIGIEASRSRAIINWRPLAQVVSTVNTRRSEEHTSELQSLMRLSYAVFCLKKKKKHKNTNDPHTHKTKD